MNPSHIYEISSPLEVNMRILESCGICGIDVY
jgi:hypothetical protein